jgi:hypothetical protein
MRASRLYWLFFLLEADACTFDSSGSTGDDMLMMRRGNLRPLLTVLEVDVCAL